MDAPSPEQQSRTVEILARANEEGSDIVDALAPVVYDELRRVAAHYMRAERADHTLQPTALANEAFARLVGTGNVEATGRAHFMRLAGKAMRQVLVDHARSKRAQKRGGGWERVPMTEAVAEFQAPNIDVLALDDALVELAKLDERQSGVVVMRFFGGLSMQEIATVLGISVGSAENAWYFARAWMRRYFQVQSPE